MINRSVRTAVTISAFVAASVIPLLPAFAGSQNSAAVISKGFCGGFVPDANGNRAFFIGTNQLHTVITSSGVSSLICQFDIPEGEAPGKATQSDGFRCWTYLGSTYDSKMVATPGGKATLSCRVNGAAAG